MRAKWLCAIGLHRWKQVRRYSEAGEIVWAWPGIRCRTHYPWSGVERCRTCGKQIKGRKDWFDVAFDWGFSILATAALALWVMLMVLLARFLWPSLVETFKAAWT